MIATYNTKFDIGDTVKVRNGEWQNVDFCITDIEVTLSYPKEKNSIYPLVKYHGMVRQGTSWQFGESQLERANVDLSHCTFEVEEGDVIRLHDGDWTIIDVKKDRETGQPYMGGPVETYSVTITFTLQQANEVTTMVYDPDTPMMVVGHKRKTYT